MQLGLSVQMYACVQAGQLSGLTDYCHITGTATDTKMQATCMQSSAVGASTTARGELRRVRLSLALRSSSRMRCTSGSRYASVFPLPAWDSYLQLSCPLHLSHLLCKFGGKVGVHSMQLEGHVRTCVIRQDYVAAVACSERSVGCCLDMRRPADPHTEQRLYDLLACANVPEAVLHGSPALDSFMLPSVSCDRHTQGSLWAWLLQPQPYSWACSLQLMCGFSGPTVTLSMHSMQPVCEGKQASFAEVPGALKA